MVTEKIYPGMGHTINDWRDIPGQTNIDQQKLKSLYLKTRTRYLRVVLKVIFFYFYCSKKFIMRSFIALLLLLFCRTSYSQRPFTEVSKQAGIDHQFLVYEGSLAVEQ